MIPIRSNQDSDSQHWFMERGGTFITSTTLSTLSSLLKKSARPMKKCTVLTVVCAYVIIMCCPPFPYPPPPQKKFLILYFACLHQFSLFILFCFCCQLVYDKKKLCAVAEPAAERLGLRLQTPEFQGLRCSQVRAKRINWIVNLN
jgi:hypothetical protein